VGLAVSHHIWSKCSKKWGTGDITEILSVGDFRFLGISKAKNFG
jgi:hypothetical protein